MRLHVLSRGRSKTKLKPVMIDSLRKVENYRKALMASDVKSFHYAITPAEVGAKIWRKDRTNKWTGYNDSVPKIVR